MADTQSKKLSTYRAKVTKDIQTADAALARGGKNLSKEEKAAMKRLSGKVSSTKQIRAMAKEHREKKKK